MGQKIKRATPAIIAVASLVIGAVIMTILLATKSGPAEAIPDSQEAIIQVEAYRAQPETVPITIAGYGEVRPLIETPIAAEVTGRVTEIASNLVEGGIVHEDDLLLTIDPAEYRARVNDAKAQVLQSKSNIRALELEFENEKIRLESVKRSTELAQRKLKRAQDAVKEGIGSTADVDAAEQELVLSRNSQELVERSVNVYPVRIEEAESQLTSASEKLRIAEMNLTRTKVRAPYTGRLKDVQVDRGQTVSAGKEILTLTDDSLLEISVALDSREVRRSVRFEKEDVPSGAGWFSKVTPVPVRIVWTEDTESPPWLGTLHRVESFDPKTRTITMAVRIENGQVHNASNQPLVEGMFCKIDIPCKPLENVFRVPVAALTFESTVYTAVDGRLRTTPVEIARRDEDYAYVKSGILPGNWIIQTRLVNPLENSLCDIKEVAAPCTDDAPPVQSSP